MCGVAGVFSVCEEIAGSPVHSMIDKLDHRGPDAKNSVVVSKHLQLAHTRLSVIEMGRQANQPMRDEAGHWLSFNGEIYNYKELAQEMDLDDTSDSRILLYGLSRFGIPFLKRVQGMYAFAYWDETAKKLFLARDSFGIKPMFWSFQNNFYFFASEIKAIIPALSHLNLDKKAISDYLNLGYVLTPATPFEQIQEIPAGHFLEISEQGAFLKSLPRIKAKATDSFTDILKKDLEAHLVSDVPVTLLVSGGVDSSCLATVLKGRGIAMSFLHMDNSHFSEERKVAELEKFLEQKIQRVRANNISLQDFFKIIYHVDDLISDPALISNFQIYKANRKSKVVIGGDGADELFLGYPTYFATSLSRWIRFLPFRWFLALMIWILEAFEPKRRYPLSMKIKRLLMNPKKTLYQRHLLWRSPQTLHYVRPEFNKVSYLESLDIESAFKRSDSFYLRLSKLDLSTYLQSNILKKVDRLSMMFSIEARVPFLTENMRDYSFSLTDGQKKSLFRGKLPLRKFLRHNGPSKPLSAQKKMGFGSDLKTFVEQKDVSRFANQPCRLFFSIICQEKYDGLLNKRKKTYDDYYSIFNLIVLKAWLQIHGKAIYD